MDREAEEKVEMFGFVGSTSVDLERGGILSEGGGYEESAGVDIG